MITLKIKIKKFKHTRYSNIGNESIHCYSNIGSTILNATKAKKVHNRFHATDEKHYVPGYISTSSIEKHFI